MGIQIDGIEDMSILLSQIGARAERGVFQKMKKEGEKVVELAKRFAPVDEGNLEEAIKLEVGGGGRNDLGQFQRKDITVYIDGDVASSKPGETVEDYAWEVHEHMTPAGTQGLGLKSKIKQAANPGDLIGGKFLERALDEVTDGLIERVGNDAVKGR